jgi:penicillin-binding protein 2
MVTPLQMAVMTAAIANGGNVLEPRVVERIEPTDASTGEAPTRFPTGQIRNRLQVDPRNLEIIRNAMLQDVVHKENGRSDGTGRRAAVEGMQVCGKTGTAQVLTPGQPKLYITWFISFAPFESPRYAVVVMVESGASGGDTCAPVAHDIYEAILKRERPGSAKPPASVALN